RGICISRGARAGVLRSSFRRRKVELDARAGFFGSELEAPAGLAHAALDDMQAKAGDLAAFGGGEGLEGARQEWRRHAAARVDELDQHEIGRRVGGADA